MNIVQKIREYKHEQRTRTSHPLSRVPNVYLSGGVDVAPGHRGKGREGILFVVDVSQEQVGIHIVGKRLVANTRKTVTNSLEGCSGGQPKRKIYRVENRDGSTWQHMCINNV